MSGRVSPLLIFSLLLVFVTTRILLRGFTNYLIDLVELDDLVDQT
jgi:hypothetical protein